MTYGQPGGAEVELQWDGTGPVLQQSRTGLGAKTLGCYRMENKPLGVTTPFSSPTVRTEALRVAEFSALNFLI